MPRLLLQLFLREVINSRRGLMLIIDNDNEEERKNKQIIRKQMFRGLMALQMRCMQQDPDDVIL